jgi:hypothetical protein
MKKPFQKHYDLKLVSCSTCHLKGEKKDLVNEFGETIQKLLADTDVPAQMQVCKEADEETKDRIEKKLAEEFTVVLKRLDELKAPSGKAYAQAVRDATGYAIGGIPPLGHATRLATYCDRDLLGYETVWAAAGTPDTVFAVRPDALVLATGAIVCDLAAATPTSR